MTGTDEGKTMRYQDIDTIDRAAERLTTRLHEDGQPYVRDLNRTVLARRSSPRALGRDEIAYWPAKAATPFGSMLTDLSRQALRNRSRDTDRYNWARYCEERNHGHRWDGGFADGRDMGARCYICGAREE